LILVVILIATILEGILGALLVVPVLASAVIIVGYIQRKVLGLPAFEDDGSQQFVAPPEKINPPRRGIRKKEKPASDSSAPDSVSPAATHLKTHPARKKNNSK
jgi:hypothetical protein